MGWLNRYAETFIPQAQARQALMAHPRCQGLITKTPAEAGGRRRRRSLHILRFGWDPELSIPHPILAEYHPYANAPIHGCDGVLCCALLHCQYAD